MTDRGSSLRGRAGRAGAVRTRAPSPVAEDEVEVTADVDTSGELGCEKPVVDIVRERITADNL